MSKLLFVICFAIPALSFAQTGTPTIRKNPAQNDSCDCTIGQPNRALNRIESVSGGTGARWTRSIVGYKGPSNRVPIYEYTFHNDQNPNVSSGAVCVRYSCQPSPKCGLGTGKSSISRQNCS